MGIFSRIAGLFRRKEKKMKKFDILKEVVDANGSKRNVMESGVMAADRQQLVFLYDQCGEKIINILREYEDPDSRAAGKPRMYTKEDAERVKRGIEELKRSNPGANTGNMSTKSIDMLLGKGDDAFIGNSSSVPPPADAPVQRRPPLQPKRLPPPGQDGLHVVSAWREDRIHPPVRSKPRFFTIGGITVKEENGKIYQKQWCEISEAEMENYRIISNSTNKIVPMTGKHLEVKKWVHVQDMDEDNEEFEETEDCPPRKPQIRVKRPQQEEPPAGEPEAKEEDTKPEEQKKEGVLING